MAIDKPVAVVICNYNRSNDVVRAVESVYANAGGLADPIVVDNNSSDDSVAKLKDIYPNLAIYVLPQNIGGAGGFGFGMQQAVEAEYDFVALLDSDAIIEPGTLASLLDYLKKEPDVGVVGPAICKMDSPEEVQEAGGNFNLDVGSFVPLYRGINFSHIPKDVIDCDYLPACCFLTRREVIEDIGVFPVEYFLYWDDIQWCSKARDKGWKIQVLTWLKALHKGGGAIAKNTLPRYYYWRNKVKYFQYRHIDIYEFKKVLIKNLFFKYLKKDFQAIDVILSGVRDGCSAKNEIYQPDSAIPVPSSISPVAKKSVWKINFKINLSSLDITLQSQIVIFLKMAVNYPSVSFYLDFLPEHILKMVTLPENIIINEAPPITPELQVYSHCFNAIEDEPAVDLFWNYWPIQNFGIIYKEIENLVYSLSLEDTY